MKGNKIKDTEFPSLDVLGINKFIAGREDSVKYFFKKIISIDTNFEIAESK